MTGLTVDGIGKMIAFLTRRWQLHNWQLLRAVMAVVLIKES